MTDIQTSIIYINITQNTGNLLKYPVFVYSTKLTMVYICLHMVCLLSLYLNLPEDG